MVPWIELPEKEKDLVLVSENEAFNVGMLTGEIMVLERILLTPAVNRLNMQPGHYDVCRLL